jgi:hypothetical protein
VKKTLIAVLTALSLAGVMMISTVVTKGASAAPATPAAVAVPAQRRMEPGHPHMKAAMRHLEEAKAELERSVAEYHGHRVKAIELTNQAIQEIKDGLGQEGR